MRRLGEGREAEVFEWDDERVVRLFRAGAGTLVDREAAALRAARARGAPVPEVYEQIEHDGRIGLLMERVDGPDGLTLIGRRPWVIRGLALDIGRVHASLHAVPAPATQPGLRTVLEQRIGDAPHLPDELRELAMAQLRELPDGDRLLHGDLHPGNVLLGANGPVVIDWTNATRGAPDADVARSVLIAQLGSVPPGTARLVRILDRFGRGFYRHTYLRGYGRARRFDPVAVERWVVPHAAARLWEDIPEEVESLLRFLRVRLDRV